jgi:sortase (surface protein transpeptidase)
MRRFWWVPIALLAFFLLVQPRGLGRPASPTPASGQSAAAQVPDATGTPEIVPPPTPSTVLEATTTPVAREQTPTAPAERPTARATSTPEPPALVPEVAPPTPAAEPTSPPAPSQPIRLIVPEIDLDLRPVPVGLDDRRVPIVPRHDVGWFTDGAYPAQGSNVVFWGHVLRWKDAPQVPAPFARVHELRPGAELIIATADGREHHYRVTEQVQVRPQDVQYIYPTNGERVTLVSCIGDKVIVNGTLTKEFRLVTIAQPVSETGPAPSSDGAG